MTHDPQTCRPDDDLATAANVMWDLDCGCVPVVGEGRRVVGIITDRDACMAALMSGRPLHELRVAEVMSKEIAYCRPSDGLDEAHAMMRARRVRRLPVTDGEGRVVGVLSLHDIARAAKRDRRFFPRVKLRDVALTFAEVSQPAGKPAMPALSAPSVAYAE